MGTSWQPGPPSRCPTAPPRVRGGGPRSQPAAGMLLQQGGPRELRGSGCHWGPGGGTLATPTLPPLAPQGEHRRRAGGFYCIGGSWKPQPRDAQMQGSCWAITASPRTCESCRAQTSQCQGKGDPKKHPAKRPRGAGGRMQEGDVPTPALRAIPSHDTSTSSILPTTGTGIKAAAPIQQQK